MSDTKLDSINGMTCEEIHAATTKILADPLLHKFYNWTVDMSRAYGEHRALFASPAKETEEPSKVECPNCLRPAKSEDDHLSLHGMEYLCHPAQPAPAVPSGDPLPEEISVAVSQMRTAAKWMEAGVPFGRLIADLCESADDLEAFWRSQPKRPAVAMTKELEHLISQVEIGEVTYRLQHGCNEAAYFLTELCKKVRAQAEQPKREVPEIVVRVAKEYKRRFLRAGGPSMSTEDYSALNCWLATQGEKGGG
jgi:hypothetical protein